MTDHCPDSGSPFFCPFPLGPSACIEGVGGRVRPNIKKLSLKRIMAHMAERGPSSYPEVIAALCSDPRSGAQRLVQFCQSKLEESRRERQATERMFGYERQIWAMGYRRVAGVSEVGRGSLAGPVVAAAVILPGEILLPGISEQRRLSGRRRLELHRQIRESPVRLGLGMVQPEGVDEASVTRAAFGAMSRAVAALGEVVDYLLVDGLHLPGLSLPQAVGGENLSCSIAIAALVARVERDNYMVEMDRLYPQYGFASHKGYGTPEHRAALRRWGTTPIHRRHGGAVQGFPSLTHVAGTVDD